MQPAQATNHLMSRPEVEMIGVAENELRAQLFQNVLRHGFYCARGAARHEGGGLHLAVRGLHAAEAGPAGPGPGPERGRQPAVGIGTATKLEPRAWVRVSSRTSTR